MLCEQVNWRSEKVPNEKGGIMTKTFKAALFGGVGCAGETIPKIYGSRRLEALGDLTDLYPRIVDRNNIAACLPELREVEVIFSTWGMFPLSEAELDQMPNLRAFFYAAGTVGYFAPPMLRRGITVVSAAAANAVPVAEFTLGQILLANKGFFRNVREYQHCPGPNGVLQPLNAFRGRGNFDQTVSVLGAGQIGRKLIELLRPFHLRVLCFDPFLSQKGAELLGVEKVSLDRAFAEGNVVTNHLANLPATVGMLDGPLLCSLPPNATFINTGRGQTVNHGDLLEVMTSRQDLTALLDVTDPEPLPADSPLLRLDNVQVTSHIAGSIGNEVSRNAEVALQEFCAWRDGEPLRYSVTLEMLETMA